MAKDDSSQPLSDKQTSCNPPSVSDQQKVPPLRIVLSSSANQRGSTAVLSQITTDQSAISEKESSIDNCSIKKEERVRIRLGTGSRSTQKPNASKQIEPVASVTNDSEQSNSRIKSEQSRSANSNREDGNFVSYSHLRRITRRSQRSAQTVNNEDEESRTSMTSIDENQDTSNQATNSDSNHARLEEASTNSNGQQCASNNQNSTNAPNSETSRKTKRKKVESISEPTIDLENHPSFLNDYRLPAQNSIELFKHIRKQVDKKIKSLNSVQPGNPHGFREYLISRGTYLLDGNKLGNGTFLFMNEDGKWQSGPVGKYRALRQRTTYTVPDCARVPMGLPVNSPLYNLFVDQEKERHKLRMQHIKEREKLTLAAEQEIVRVYNQASLAAANQDETFSVCTMLRHQEVYNYLDQNGALIQVNEEVQTEQVKQDGVRTRRRQHEHQSPPINSGNNNNKKEQVAESAPEPSSSKDAEKTTDATKKIETAVGPETDPAPPVKDANQTSENDSGKDSLEVNQDDQAKTTDDAKPTPDEQSNSRKSNTTTDEKLENDVEMASSGETSEVKQEKMDVCEKEAVKDADDDAKMHNTNDTEESPKTSDTQEAKEAQSDSTKETTSVESTKDNVDMEKSDKATDETTVETKNVDVESKSKDSANEEELVPAAKDGDIMTEEDKKAQRREAFVAQLQAVDDKWDAIRAAMLIRHKNEAESLHAIQKLEWEWKTKEIGACDVRTTPIIDDTLVPRLNIYSQDY